MKYYLAFILAICALGKAAAGVLIESVDDSGRPSTVIIDGNKARIDHAIPGGYMILDLETKQAYAVDNTRHLVMDLNTPFVQHSAHAAVAMRPRQPSVEIKALGPGPKIHGYTTVHYRISVREHHCFDEFLASAAAADPHIQRFLNTVSRLSDSADEVRHNLLFNDADPCDAAADTIDDRYPELGLPMRTVDADGRVSHEITRIELDTAITAEPFSWPADFPLLSRQEVHERLNRQRGEAANEEAALAEALERQRRINTQIKDLSNYSAKN